MAVDIVDPTLAVGPRYYYCYYSCFSLAHFIVDDNTATAASAVFSIFSQK